MKNQIPPQNRKNHGRRKFIAFWQWTALFAVLVGLAANNAAASLTLYTNGFDSYAVSPATSLTDTTVTFLPTGPGNIRVEDGIAQANVTGGLGWNGVQLINWATASAYNSGNCMLLRPNTAFRCTFDPRGGTNVVWEFSMLSSRAGAGGGARSYRISLLQQGADQNTHDFVIFRGNQGTAITTADRMEAFDGRPGKTWTILTNNSSGLEYSVASGVWHHYKFVADAVSRTFDLYVDGVLTTTNYSLSRPQNLMVSEIRFASEASGGGTGAGDYIMIDNVSLTVDGEFIDLASGTFTDGFESYTASTSANVSDPNTDNDPAGPWVTAETAGVENGKAFLTNSVQVVDSSVTTPQSGSKCLMVSQQQTSGSTISWAPATNDDVRITWWAKVPAAPNTSADHVMLRVSLYAWEAEYSAASDTILIGYGHRHTGENYGDINGIVTFSRWFSEWWQNGQWGDTFKTFTPDVWEEYQLTTDVNRNSYTLIKNPSSSPVTIIEDGQYISSWGNNKKFNTVAFSTSNGGSTASPHAAAYVDNVKVEPYTHTDGPAPRPYSIVGTGPAARFTNYTVLTLPGRTIGGVAVSPVDSNTIVFTVDEEVNGSIMKATKVGSGNWVIDPTPIVSGLYNPNGLTINTNGDLWFVRDAVKGGQSSGLMRLKAPWGANTVEEIVTDFGSAPTNRWDQPCDLAFYNVGATRMLAVLDRGVDASNNPNAIWTVDPATGLLKQSTYNEAGANQLVAPDSLAFGFGLGGNANGMALLTASNEFLTIWEGDDATANGVIVGWDTTTGANTRNIDISASGVKFGVGINVDPTTGRIWVADNVRQYHPLSVSAVPQIVSFPTDGTLGSFSQELSFPITTPDPGRPDRTIRMTDPGLRFSPDGKFLVVADKALHSGGGRLLIFHSEPFTVTPINITSTVRTGSSVALTWTSGGAVNYVVQRSATVDGTYTTISPLLTTTQYTDTSSPADKAFYKVLATQQN